MSAHQQIETAIDGRVVGPWAVLFGIDVRSVYTIIATAPAQADLHAEPDGVLPGPDGRRDAHEAVLRHQNAFGGFTSASRGRRALSSRPCSVISRKKP